jgi:enolase
MKISKIQEKEFRDSNGLLNLQIELFLENESSFKTQARIRNFQIISSENCFGKITYQNENIKTSESLPFSTKQNQNLITPNLSNIFSGQELQAPELDSILMDLDDEIQSKYKSEPDLYNKQQLIKSGFGQVIKPENQESRSLWDLRKTLTSMALYTAYAQQEQVELYELFAYLLGTTSVTLPCPQLSIMKIQNCFEKNLYIKNFLLAPVGAETLEKAIKSCEITLDEFKKILQQNNKFSDQNKNLSKNQKSTPESNQKSTSQINPEFSPKSNPQFKPELNQTSNPEVNHKNDPDFNSDKEILEFIQEALNQSAHLQTNSCAIAIEIDAEQIYDTAQKKYCIHNNFFNAPELINFYEELIQKFPIYSIESGMSIQDWQGWDLILKTLANKIQLVKNFSNNPNLSGRDILENVLNNNISAKAIIIDPLKIGTITETLQLMNLCKTRQVNPIVLSTEDSLNDFLSDFAIGTSAGQFKIEGNSTESYEKKCKRLLEIEKQLMELGNRI